MIKLYLGLGLKSVVRTVCLNVIFKHLLNHIAQINILYPIVISIRFPPALYDFKEYIGIPRVWSIVC